jgi:outer membrane protein assembly factor BamE (lipoprotein component of BamABCDE complex)
MHALVKIGVTLGLATLAAGCSSISDHRGYLMDEALVQAVQPGIDNEQSVEGTLGRPTFTSRYGEKTWYYVSSTTGQRPFGRPRIKQHDVLAVKFDANGNVISSQRWGMDKVAFLSANGDKTPVLGKHRSFLEDLFGNIGQVGSFGNNSPAGGAGPNGS